MVTTYKSGVDVDPDDVVVELRRAADNIDNGAPVHAISLAEHAPAAEDLVKEKVAVVFTPTIEKY